MLINLALESGIFLIILYTHRVIPIWLLIFNGNFKCEKCFRDCSESSWNIEDDVFVKIVQPLTIFTESSFLDVWPGSVNLCTLYFLISFSVFIYGAFACKLEPFQMINIAYFPYLIYLKAMTHSYRHIGANQSIYNTNLLIGFLTSRTLV